MPAPMESQAGWKWYGFGGHFVGNARCSYHLCTRVPGYLISTLGNYIPKGKDKPEPIGAGPDSLFETMVFACTGDDENGDPIYDVGACLTMKRYAKSIEAEQGHYDFCHEYAAKGAVQ